MITALPFRAEPLSNDVAEEFLFDCTEGLPPSRQKRIILRARDPQLRLIDDATASRLISALGLGPA